MQRIPNPEMDRIILNALADKYKLNTKRDGVHLSTLVYCLTKGFFDQNTFIEPTDKEVLLFALGYGLQDVMTPKEAETPIYEKEGVIYRPDFFMKLGGDRLVEIKTTRSGLNKNLEQLPETWIEYMKGGCYMMDKDTYELAGLYILGNYHPPFPMIYSETIIFDQEEIAANWKNLMSRKEVYLRALEAGQPPEPFKFCKSWECQYDCRYKMNCDAVTMLSERGTKCLTTDLKE